MAGQQTSLTTTRKEEAQELLLTKSEADRERQLNLDKAKIYLWVANSYSRALSWA